MRVQRFAKPLRMTRFRIWIVFLSFRTHIYTSRRIFLLCALWNRILSRRPLFRSSIVRMHRRHRRVGSCRSESPRPRFVFRRIRSCVSQPRRCEDTPHFPTTAPARLAVRTPCLVLLPCWPGSTSADSREQGLRRLRPPSRRQPSNKQPLSTYTGMRPRAVPFNLPTALALRWGPSLVQRPCPRRR